MTLPSTHKDICSVVYNIVDVYIYMLYYSKIDIRIICHKRVYNKQHHMYIKTLSIVLLWDVVRL